MKKFLLLMLVVWTGIASSCSYDDDELLGSVNDLANRVSAMESLTQQMNSDISAIQTLVTALENQEAVCEVEKLTDGYILHFTNGTSATINNGKEGTAGNDAPAMGVQQENGVYYWTLTVNGATQWLTDDLGNRIAVTAAATAGSSGAAGASGSAGKSPKLQVDKDGYWMVSYDGTNYTYIMDGGNKISALGTEGKTQFSKVEIVEDPETKEKKIKVTNNDEQPMTFVFPILDAIEFFSDEACTTSVDIKKAVWDGNDQKLTYYYKINLKSDDNPYQYQIVDFSGGMEKPVVDETKQSITVELKGNQVTDSRAVVLFYNDARTLTAVFRFVVAPWDGQESAAVTPVNDEYSMATPANLKWLADAVNNGTDFTGKTIKLLNDIDLAGKSWTPIGSEKPFTGIFDGNGKTVKGLSVELISTSKSVSRNTTPTVKGAGLFGVVKGATLKGITIKGASINMPGVDGAGALVGYVLGGVTIEGVTIKKDSQQEDAKKQDTKVEGSQNVGSVVGFISAEEDVVINNCEVRNSSVAADQSSTSETASAGGIVGALKVENKDIEVKINNCAVDGTDLSTSSDETESKNSSSGGIIGSLIKSETVDAADLADIVNVTGNSVSDTKVADTPSSETEGSEQKQGAVVGNLADLDASVSAGIINGNTVSENVEIATQLTLQNLSAVMAEVLKNGDAQSFDVKGDITENTTVQVPEIAKDITFNFGKLNTAKDKLLTIQHGEGKAAGTATSKLTVNMASGDQPQYLEIKAPTSTVTLATGHYASVSALVAKNTLIVEKDVTIDQLSVEDGNVQVFGHVVNLVRAAGSTSVIKVVIEEGGQVDHLPETGVEVIDKNIKEDLVEKNDIYTVYTAAGWKTIAAMVNEGNTFAGKTIRLGRDIDLNLEVQAPIGTDKVFFAGTLDGMGHSIKNLKVDYSATIYAGLFGRVEEAVFQNIRFVGGEVKATGTARYAGALFGYGRKATVINCHNESCNILQINEKNSGYAGGLVGSVTHIDNAGSAIIACSNAAHVSGAYCPSGISGGGFMGYTNIVACVNTGKVTYSGTNIGSGIYAAGITANFGGSSSNFMYGCYSDCDMTQGSNHGALVADAGTSHRSIYYSYTANTEMQLFGQIWGAANKSVGYGTYNEVVDELNKGIQQYNWSAVVPCNYQFVKGDKPTWVKADPSTNPGAGNNNFGGGGNF